MCFAFNLLFHCIAGSAASRTLAPSKFTLGGGIRPLDYWKDKVRAEEHFINFFTLCYFISLYLNDCCSYTYYYIFIFIIPGKL